MTVLDPNHARAIVRRRRTAQEGSNDPGLLEAAIRTLWPDEEAAAAMRDILLPVCIGAPGERGAFCWGCAVQDQVELDAEAVAAGQAAACSGWFITELSGLSRRRPTCPECRSLLLECREWMPEWWSVEEMTAEEAGVVLNASLKGEASFPQNYVKMAVLRRAPGKE